MTPSIFLTAATRTKLPRRPTSTSISLRDAVCFIETFVNGSQRCYATHSATSIPEGSNQPASHRPYTARRTLLHRTYLSLLRSTPLIVIFQHNNLRGGEYTALRRELKNVMAGVDAQVAAAKAPPADSEDGALTTSQETPIGPKVKMTIVNKEVFSAALRVAEFLPPDSDVRTASGPEAYELTVKRKGEHPLAPLLVGPIGILEFPSVTPPYLLAALNLLFPEKATFKKGTDPQFISGVQKMLLLGAKIDKVGGRTIDTESLRYIGSLGDLDTLRGQLLGVLQSASAGLVATLQGPSRGLWVMVEGRRKMLDEANKPASEDASPPAQ